MDPRVTKLAEMLVDYSNEIQPKESVLIISYGVEGLPLAKELYRLCMIKGAYPRCDIRDDEFGRIFMENANDDQLDYTSPWGLDEASGTDAMFQIICDRNTMELAHIDQKKMIRRRKATKKFSDIIHEKKWLLFEYPTALGAYNAKMSLESWENFVFNACLVDWAQAGKEQEVLKKIMESTKKVQIVADETDITFDITNQPAVKCCGKRNMPDGEVFTAPLKTGVNGTILFNTPTSYMNREFNWIKLTFKDGKVVESESDNKKALDEILDTDEGSRYLGEFAFGTNKNIQIPVKSILFDEKIGGSNHMALGKCYEDEAPNGNDSNIHWDLIIRHKDANGKVYMDGELVQENGVWIHPELKIFN
jgi:aminopeptidase